jgi:hypothetical protein
VPSLASIAIARTATTGNTARSSERFLSLGMKILMTRSIAAASDVRVGCVGSGIGIPDGTAATVIKTK